MLAIIIVLILVVVLMLIEVPVAFSFAIGAFLIALATERDISYLVPYAFWQVGGFALLALPLFIMTGSVMGVSGISDRLLQFINSIVGRLKGGLGAVTVLSCMLFGAIAGSGSSAIAAVGSILIPRMVDHGYPKGHATALVACSSVLAQLVPPSIPMIVFALAAGIPVTAAFLSTVGAGVLIAIAYCVLNYLFLRNESGIRLAPKYGLARQCREIAISSKNALGALFLPVILLGGIYSGMFTPTEAAAVAFVYAMLLGLVVYRGLSLRAAASAVVEAALVTGAIVVILFSLLIMSRAMILNQVPGQLASFMLSLSDNRLVLLAIINVLLLVIGMLVDDISGSILAAVILMPVAQQIGVHPIHFAAIVGTNLGLGNVTPPCAPLLYMAGGIGKQSLDEYIRPTLMFLLPGHLPVVILVTYVPELSLFLPRLILGIG